MGVMVQIRDVPENVHRRLKSHAALAGMSLSEYLLRKASEMAEKPSMEEWLARLKEREPVNLAVDVVDIIREMREERDQELYERAIGRDRR
jgi:hypothetical protein